MKNNGKVRDVRSLTIHWNISEIVYCNFARFILPFCLNYIFCIVFLLHFVWPRVCKEGSMPEKGVCSMMLIQ